MNIFVLDTDPCKCATYHCDKHVVKMILEYAQLLCTAHHELGYNGVTEQRVDELYKPTHKNHPCAKWVRESRQNYYWLYTLFSSLLIEFYRRRGKDHATRRLHSLLSMPPDNIPDSYLTPFAQAMPEHFKHNDAVSAYRHYYNVDKRYMARWNWPNTNTPYWWVD